MTSLFGQAESLRLVDVTLQELRADLIAALDPEVHAELRARVEHCSRIVGLDLRGAAERLDRKGSAEERAKAAYEARLDKLHVTNLNEAAFPVRGYMVYMLWGDDTEKPLYVGQSMNILARLGSHLGDPKKRGEVERVTVLRFPSRSAMDAEERRLIRLHCPPWNVAGVDRAGHPAA